MGNKNKQKKLKIWWFSKAGKITLWVIFWIIVIFFCAVWIFHTNILYHQLNEYWEDFQWWYPSDLDIYNTLHKNHWIGVSEEFFDQLSKKRYWWLVSNFVVPKDYKWKNWKDIWIWMRLVDNSVEINDSFTEWEWTWWITYLHIPYNSKFFDDIWEPIYSDELDEFNQRITTWKTIHELKLEVTNAWKVQSYIELVNNSEHEHIRQNESRVIMHSFAGNISKPTAEWETKCVIITPFDRITKEIIDAHPENCDFWILRREPWFDETYLEITATKWLTNHVANSNIKVSHITVDLPIYK